MTVLVRRTTAAAQRHLCDPNGTHRYETTFFRLKVPTPDVAYVAHFFQANFELHPHNLEK
jgi:phosphatidylethanolamine-binding protein (PEBP) family uncharacterized protein